MQVTQTLSDGLKREFKVVLPAADLATRLEEQLEDLKGKARINGFRPGKVPVSHLKRLYGRSIMADVVQEAVNEANRKIVEENELRLAGEPKIDLALEKEELDKAFDAKADFIFDIALEVLPKLEVGGFGDIEIECLVTDVPEADVDSIVQRFAEQNRVFVPKEGEDAVAAKGDKVTLDFVGKIEGEPFPGGTGENVDVVLGSDSFIPGFEDQVEGMKVGEQRVLSLRFPDDYASAKLAGQAATFDVTVKTIAAPGDLVIDDELAKAFGFESLDKLRESVRANFEREYAAASRRKWKRGLLDELDKRYVFEVPEGLVAQEFDSVWRKVEGEQKLTGKSFEDEGTTEEAARADYRKIAERRVRLGLLLADIGEKAGLSVSDEELTQALVERAKSFPGQEKLVWDYYRNNPKALTEVRAPLFEEKVIDHIMREVKVSEKKVSKDELLKIAEDEDKGEGSEAAGNVRSASDVP